MNEIHPFKATELDKASELWRTLMPSWKSVKDFIDHSPRMLYLANNILDGRILIDLHSFEEELKAKHPHEYESQSSTEILCDLYSADAFRLVYALTYTGKEDDFDADCKAMLDGRNKAQARRS